MLIKPSSQRHLSRIAVFLLTIFSIQIFEPFIISDTSLFAANIQEVPGLLEQAQEHYVRADFDQTMNLLIQFLNENNLDNDSKITAYTLLAKTFIAKDEPEKAKEVIRKILTIDSSYAPTLEQEKPSYVNLVADVRKEVKPEPVSTQQVETKKSNSKYYIAGAGGVAAAVIVGLLISGPNSKTEKGSDLPKPPDFPQ